MNTSYTAAWWVPGAHLQTLWGKLFRRSPRLPTRIERWRTPDGDFIDLHRLDAARGPAEQPRLLLLHGLEGSPRSHYVGGLFAQALRRGWAADLLVFRSCGPEPNHLPRFYHSGETGDLGFVVERLSAASPTQPVVLVGVSLGGNVLLKWLGERGSDLPPVVRGAAAISVPFDLERGARHIDRGFSRIYQAHFLRSLRRKALEKRARFPDLVPAEAVDQARTLFAFDNAVTAPIHGFRDATDYYTRSSALGFLSRIRLPTLLLSALDDPFLPPVVLDEVAAIARENPALHPEFVPRGGHVGFIAGRFPWSPVYYAECRTAEFLERQLRPEVRGAGCQ